MLFGYLPNSYMLMHIDSFQHLKVLPNNLEVCLQFVPFIRIFLFAELTLQSESIHI